MKYAEYIKQIEIDSLWNNGRKHICWNLNRRVNILSGVNGDGKSTILNRVMRGLENVNHNSGNGIMVITSPEDADAMRYDVVAMPEVRSDFDNDLNSLLVRYAEAEHDEEQQTHFFDILDELFAVTEKHVVREEKELVLRQWGANLPMNVLSNGEKHMLTIMLTVYLEQNQNYSLFMDEPEISLHVEWQKHLIDIILELNPNVQVVLTTHSPAVIMNGWTDMVTEVGEITE